MKKRKILSAAIAAVVLISQSAFAQSDSTEYDQYERIMNYAANLYIDETADADKMMDDALRRVLSGNPELMNQLIKAGFQSLDEYSEFYTKEEYELFNKNLNHTVYGIGVSIQQVGDYVTVMKCLDGGGAIAAGIQEGDKIYKVDGADVTGQSVEKVQDLVVGELGTDVTVTVLRDGREYSYTITRGEVNGSTVGSTILDGNIGYIEIVNFAVNTAQEFADALDEFDAAGVENIILDLRDNPGGYLDAAVMIASAVVPKGTIVKTVYRNSYENEEYKSEQENAHYKFAVLVNENTASSAEVLASAIQDSGVGILIGDKTYGKGVIQQMYEIWDGCAFKVTTGKYFTRNGKDINGNGIEPDEYIDNETRRIDITRYDVFDYKSKPYCGETSPNVKAAKQRLKLLGYYSGEINEKFDNALESAVYRFQEDNELFPYGVLDVSTQVRLENTFYKLEEIIDKQLEYAYTYFGGDTEKLRDETRE